MNVPGVAWVGLLLLLIPVIQAWVAMQWPEASYPITALIVGVLAAVGKWLQMYVQAKPQAPVETPPEAQSFAAPAGAVGSEKQPSKMKKWLLG